LKESSNEVSLTKEEEAFGSIRSSLKARKDLRVKKVTRNGSTPMPNYNLGVKEIENFSRMVKVRKNLIPRIQLESY